MASSRAPGSICTIATGAFGYGKARLATWLPPTTANHVPSAIWSTATCAAYLAASMFGPLIDPEVSMMTISATPPLLVAAVPAPELVTVTIACTSVAPSERNSFWNTSVRKSATVAPRSACGRCRVGGRSAGTASSVWTVSTGAATRASAAVMLSCPPCSLAQRTSSAAMTSGAVPTCATVRCSRSATSAASEQ